MANLHNSPLLWGGADNIAGMRNHVAFIAAAEVTSVPTLPATATALADFVTATGAFVFKSVGDKPKFVYTTPQSATFKAENQGEIDGQSFKQSGEFFFPGAKIEALAFARYVNNTAGYLIMEDAQGTQILVGQPGLPVRIKPSIDLGKAPTDRRGFTFTFEADSVSPMIIMGTPIDFEDLKD